MKITGFEVIPFETFSDRISFGRLEANHRIVQTLTIVHTDEGPPAEGYYFGGHFHGDRDGLLAGDRSLILDFLGPIMAGQDPLDREEIWRQLTGAKLPEHVVSVIDLALWDLAGRVCALPVHKLLGGARSRVKAYASSFNNLGQPDDYAAHAVECQNQGYRAYKIHPYHYWNPATGAPALPRPSYVDWDLAACRAVRAAVGDEMVLMFDPWGTYATYGEALQVGRELEELDFYWYEHPMSEYSAESYVRLAEELDIPICAPEILEGGIYTRADWISQRASDISRIDVLRGGITGAMKMAAVCDAFAMRCELHMSGFGNLQVLGATSADVCEYYERGLLGPNAVYEETPPYLRAPCDPLDDDGYVSVPLLPGLGYDVDWDFIEDHRLAHLHEEPIAPLHPR
ncbi:MAG TPA: enolase C-terminal domain-like protein [Acidimicrobiales bacterium]|nr:enolase C-terminal domain-like protein [Acidimicrobiales bacterium]